MLRRVIVFENPFTSKQETEEHYFHISKADLVEMEMEEGAERFTTKDGKQLTGMEAKMARIIEAEDGKTIMAVTKDIIRRSYAKKVGERFVKSKENWEEFESSEAYSQLLFELCTDAEKSAEFMNGALPNDLAAEAAKAQAQALAAGASGSTPAPEAPTVEAQLLTAEEAAAMDKDELTSGLVSGKYKLS